MSSTITVPTPSDLDLKILDNEKKSVWYNSEIQNSGIPYRIDYHPHLVTSYKADKSVYYSKYTEDTLTPKEYIVNTKEICVELYGLPFKEDLNDAKKEKAHNFYGTLYDMIVTFKYIYPMFFFACGRFIKWTSVIVISQFGKYYLRIVCEDNTDSETYELNDGFTNCSAYSYKELIKIKKHIEIPTESYYGYDENTLAADDESDPLIYEEFYETRNNADIDTYIYYDSSIDYQENISYTYSYFSKVDEDILFGFNDLGYFSEPGVNIYITDSYKFTLIYKSHTNIYQEDSRQYSYITFNTETTNNLSMQTFIPVEMNETSHSITRVHSIDACSLTYIDRNYPIYSDNIMVFTSDTRTDTLSGNPLSLDNSLEVRIDGGNILTVDNGNTHPFILAKVFYKQDASQGYSLTHNISTNVLIDYIKKINTHKRNDEEQPWSDVPDYILNLLHELDFKLLYRSTTTPTSYKGWESSTTSITDTNKKFALGKIAEADETLLSNISNDKYYHLFFYGKYVSENLDDDGYFTYALKSSNYRCLVFFNGKIKDGASADEIIVYTNSTIKIKFDTSTTIEDDDILELECFDCGSTPSSSFLHIRIANSPYSSTSLTINCSIKPDNNVIMFYNGLYIPQNVVSVSRSGSTYNVTIQHNSYDVQSGTVTEDAYILPSYLLTSKNTLVANSSTNTVYTVPSTLNTSLPLSREDTFVFVNGYKIPYQYINYLSNNTILIRANMLMDTVCAVKHTWFNNKDSDSIVSYVQNSSSKKATAITSALSTLSDDNFKLLIDENKTYSKTPINNV